MSFFSNIRESFVQAALYRGKFLAHQEFINMSERQLEEFGLSKELLMEGVSAWPWKLEPTEAGSEQGDMSAPVIEQIVPASGDLSKAGGGSSSPTDHKPGVQVSGNEEVFDKRNHAA